MMVVREYHSPVRDKTKAETRQRILDAAVRVVLDEGVHAFTVPNVARRAAITDRTVYRHFATREAILEGLSDLLESPGESFDARAVLRDTASFSQAVRKAYDEFEKHRDVSRAVVLTSLALRHRLPVRQHRSDEFLVAVRERFPALSPDLQRRAAHLLRSLVGSRQWYVLTEEQGLASSDALETVLWAVTTLFADLERRAIESAALPSAVPSSSEAP